MLSGLVRTDDDRGNSVIYRDPMYHASELAKTDRERINRKKNNSPSRLLMLVIMVMLVIQVIRLLSLSIPAMVEQVAFILTGTVLAWWVVIPLVRRVMWSRRWKARYKALERCPACQYSLATLEPAPDGCTICPECGGAWKLATSRA